MKKITNSLILYIFCVILCLVTPKNSNATSLENLPGGGEIYHGLQLTDPQNMNIAGINLALYDYVELYQYAIVQSQTLFILGRTQSEDIKLSSVTLTDQTCISIARHPRWEGFTPLRNIRFTVFSLYKQQPRTFYIMLTYEKDVSGRRNELTSTWIEVFRAGLNKTYPLINKEETKDTDISLYPKLDTDDKYRIIAYRDRPGAPQGGVRPAIKSKTETFLSDVNGDGYFDILVWKQIYLS